MEKKERPDQEKEPHPQQIPPFHVGHLMRQNQPKLFGGQAGRARSRQEDGRPKNSHQRRSAAVLRFQDSGGSFEMKGLGQIVALLVDRRMIHWPRASAQRSRSAALLPDSRAECNYSKQPQNE